MLCSFYILTDIMESEGEVSYTERGQGSEKSFIIKVKSSS